MDYEQLVNEYRNKFPKISREDHQMIILGALDGRNPAMSEEGFQRWYDVVGGGLEEHPEIVAEIRGSPHFVMYRESMILGKDWTSTPILNRVKSVA